MLREVFVEIGYRVDLAANGQEAVACATAERPALALIDIKMPVMDGPATLQALKSLDPAMPVLMMTAVGEGQVAELRANGAQACITKPFDVFRLRDLVQQILHKEALS